MNLRSPPHGARAAALAVLAVAVTGGACASLIHLEEVGASDARRDAGAAAPNDATVPPEGGTDAASDGNVVPVPVCAPATPFESDPKNCGSCGHDCLGGGCTAGVCGAVEIARGLSSPQCLRVDATHVFVTVEGGAGSVIRIRKTDSALETIASGHADLRFFTLDATHVFFATESGIRKVAKDGLGGTSTVTTDRFHEVAADDLALYACRYDPSSAQDVFRLTKDGASRSPIALARRGCESLAPAGDDVFIGGDILSRAKRTGTTATPELASLETRRIAVDATHVYGVAHGSDEVRRVDRMTGAISPVSKGPATVRGGDLAVDGTHVYWAVDRASNDGGSVLRALKTGGPSELVAASQRSPIGVGVDDSAVYWTESERGTVMKRAK